MISNVLWRLKVLMGTSPISATFSDSKGDAPVKLMGRSSIDPWRIALGPRRVPEWLEQPWSIGIPTKQASRPSGLPSCRGNLIMVAMPPDLGISLPLLGWLNAATTPAWSPLSACHGRTLDGLLPRRTMSTRSFTARKNAIWFKPSPPSLVVNSLTNALLFPLAAFMQWHKNREGFPNGIWTAWSGYETSPAWERGHSRGNAFGCDAHRSLCPVLSCSLAPWQQV